MPNKKLILVLLIVAALIVSGCKGQYDYLDVLDSTPVPQNVVETSSNDNPNSNNNSGVSGDFDTSNDYQPVVPGEPTADPGVTYTSSSGGARNTGGSGSSASYSDVPSRNSSSGSGDNGSSGNSGSNDNTGGDDPIYYPNVIGLTEEEAVEKLEYCDLDYDYIEYESSYAPEGTVLYQSFPADYEGSGYQSYEIGLVISAGNIPYELPSSGGVWSETFVASLPRDAQSDVVIVYEYSFTRLADQGIYTIPDAGTMIPLGAVVTFYVSQGMLVGDYVGKDFGDIYPELSQGVAYYRNYIGEFSDTVAEGVVISQNHPAGTVLTSQSTADALVIVYSIGPDASQYSPTPAPAEGDGEVPVD